MKQLLIGAISVIVALSGQSAEPSANAIRWVDGTWDESGAPKGKLLTGNSGWWGDRVKTGVTYTYEKGFEPQAPKDGTGRRLLYGAYLYQGAGGVRATYDADASADTRVCLSPVGSPAGQPFVAVLDFKNPMMISEIDVLARTTSNGVVRLSFSEDRTNWSAESERKLTRTVNRYRFDPVQRARYVRLAFEGREGPARIDSVLAWGDSADGKDGYENLPPVNAGDTMKFPGVTAKGVAILPMATPRLDAACKPKGTTPAGVTLRMARDEFETRYFAVVNGSASAKTVSVTADGFGAGVSTELMIGGVLQLKKPPKKLSDWDKKQLQTTNDYAVSAAKGLYGVRPFFSGETMPKVSQLRRYFANAGQLAQFPRAVPLMPGEGCIVMLRMQTERTAPAGLRKGVLAAGDAKLPIALDVVDLTLPPQPWMIDVWCDFTVQFPFESRRRFLNDVRRYAESGAKSVSAAPVPGSKEAELFRADPQVKANIRGTAWCDLNLLTKVISAGKFYETNAVQAQAVATCAHAAVDRYRRTGYPLDRLMVLIMDEPNVGNIRSVLEAGSAFKAAEPGVKLFLDPCHWNGYKKRLSTAEEFAAATDAALYRRVVDISVPITPLACMKPLGSLFFAPDRINATYQHPAGCFSATSAYWMHDMGLNGWSYFSYCALHSPDPFDVTKSEHPDMAYTVVYPLEEDVALTPQYEACRECTESIRLIQAVLDAGDEARYRRLRREFNGMVDRTFDRYATNLPNDKTPTEKSRPDYLDFRDRLLEKYSTLAGAKAEGPAASLLPAGKKLRLVWSDEFDGDRLDTSKWCYRTNFWGRRAPWYAGPEDNAVEIKDGFAHLKIIEKDGQLKSPQLQTGGLLWDIPQERHGIWFYPKRESAKFLKKYGYFECRCRLQKRPGWWSAFWMQAEAQGASVDPTYSGIEHDIMESFVPGKVIPAWFHYNGYGAEYRCFASSRRPPEDNDACSDDVDTESFHTYGMLWEPDGYTLYLDGRQRGYKVGTGPGEAVSHVPEFILISTEVKGCRDSGVVDSTYGSGKATPESYEAAKAGDDFVVDFVRVYELEQ